jgi:hypothetical protein
MLSIFYAFLNLAMISKYINTKQKIVEWAKAADLGRSELGLPRSGGLPMALLAKAVRNRWTEIQWPQHRLPRGDMHASELDLAG